VPPSARLARVAAAALAGALLGSGCGGANDVATELTAAGDGYLAVATSPTSNTTPAPVVSAAPLPIAQSPAMSSSVLGTVDVLDPRVAVTVAGSPTQGDLLRVSLIEGVTGITGFARMQATLIALADDRVVDVIAVDPISFRPMTPEVTAQVPELWQRLAEGDILVRHDIAHELGLDLGGIYLLEIDGVAHQVRVGAFASNGAPPIADVVVPWDLASRSERGDITDLLVGLAPQASARRVSREIEELDEGLVAVVRDGPATYQASLRGTTVQVPSFNYVDLGDGMIVIDPAWVREWVVVVDLPHLGRTRTNRLMVDPLVNVINELDSQGLIDLLRPHEFAGSWVPRHIDWLPNRPLSWHAWGLAIDVNAHSNALGATPTLDPRVVAAFEKWGFRWGGRWSRPDGMHFELERIVTAS